MKLGVEAYLLSTFSPPFSPWDGFYSISMKHWDSKKYNLNST